MNLRIKRWYTLLRGFGILRSQRELADKLISSDGTPYSQSFVSQIMRTAPVPIEIIKQIVKIYPFTSEEYFVKSGGPVIDMHDLMIYLLKKTGMTLGELAEKIPNRSKSYIAQLNNNDPSKIWQEVFDVINEHSRYRVIAARVLDEESYVPPDVSFKSEQAERLIKLVDHLTHTGVVSTAKEFCERIDIPQSMYYNMKSDKIRQDVTKNMIVSIGQAFPNISLDWLLFGIGDMYRDTEGARQISTFHLYSKMEDMNKRMAKIEYIMREFVIAALGKDSPEPLNNSLSSMP